MTHEDTVRAEFMESLKEFGRACAFSEDVEYRKLKHAVVMTAFDAARAAPPAGVEAKRGPYISSELKLAYEHGWNHDVWSDAMGGGWIPGDPREKYAEAGRIHAEVVTALATGVSGTAHQSYLAAHVTNDMVLVPKEPTPTMIEAKPLRWMVSRESFENDEYFFGEEEARQNACLGVVTTHITPLFAAPPQVEQQTAGADDWCDDCRGYTHRDDCPHAAPPPRAEEAAPTGAEPAGWKLVPIEPTQDMLDEAWNAAEGSGDTASIKAAIRAGIAAAPACDSLVVALPGLPFGRDWLRATFPLSDAEADDILRAMNIVVKADHEALFDQLTDQQQFIHDLREALGVEYEPHQHLHERMLDAARSRPVASTTDAAIRAAAILRREAESIRESNSMWNFDNTLGDWADGSEDEKGTHDEMLKVADALAPITTPRAGGESE